MDEETELKEEITRNLMCMNPEAPHNIIRYSHKDKSFIRDTAEISWRCGKVVHKARVKP